MPVAVEPIGIASSFNYRGTTRKELTPIITATTIWGKAWRGHLICVLSDNTAAAAAIQSHHQGWLNNMGPLV